MSMEDLNDIRTTLSKNASYDPSEVVLIGTHMPPSTEALVQDAVDNCRKGSMKISDDPNALVQALELTCPPNGGALEDVPAQLAKTPTIAVIYAYAYEGHTYRLPKPRLMVVKGMGDRYEASENEEASGPKTGELYLWRIGRHQMTVSIEVETGTVESMVLDGNQPGNRSVTSYHSHMQLSHRGGRLT